MVIFSPGIRAKTIYYFCRCADVLMVFLSPLRCYAATLLRCCADVLMLQKKTQTDAAPVLRYAKAPMCQCADAPKIRRHPNDASVLNDVPMMCRLCADDVLICRYADDVPMRRQCCDVAPT